MVIRSSLCSKAISRLQAAIVFLVADLESESKVKSIGIFLMSLSTLMEREEPNHGFGRNHVFVVREQHATLRKKLSPHSCWK